MTAPKAKDTRVSSKEALKMIYYVIVGLAITEALNRTFLRNITPQWPQIILLLALLPTIIRFVHGASIHLDIYSEKYLKPVFDFIGFFIQSSIFYLMASSLESPSTFSFLFGLVLLSDIIWLSASILRNYIDWAETPKQWLWSDIAIIVSLTILYRMDNTMASFWSLMAILAIAVVFSILDYGLNKNFYLPPSDDRDSVQQ